MIALSDKLEAVIEKQNVGMFDGNEIGGGEMTLFMYGPDAERLYECNRASSSRGRSLSRSASCRPPRQARFRDTRNHFVIRVTRDRST